MRINERFQNRDDIELLRISPELRKDSEERKKMIDASTAYRTEEGWA